MRPGSAAGPNAPRPIGRADPIKTPPRQSEAGSPADSASPRHADDPEPTPAHAKDYQPRQPPTTSATPSTRFAQHLESGGGRVASPNLSRLFRTESPWGIDALNAKGNFRFERELRRWRSEPALDMRRKREYLYVTWRDQPMPKNQSG